MGKKSLSRKRRATKIRSKINLREIHRLTVFRSSQHIYAQVILDSGAKVVASASTTEATLKEKNNGNINSASKVGKLIAERALELGIQKVAFDRSGYKFHGRVKALAEAAREAGLSF